MFICREFPPAAYPPGGIGTYVQHAARLLAEAGERVHVVAHRWDGAPRRRDVSVDGRLIVHRVALDDAPEFTDLGGAPAAHAPLVAAALLASPYPTQAFAWQAAHLVEQLVVDEPVDVIEAQEWEAPLAYFQLRRAAGLGPSVRPPCVVHVHSPTERIFAANRWDTTVADFAPAAALEAYSIAAADAVLCPSRFIADETIARYALDPARVRVVPYPRGDTPLVERASEVWASPTVCHVGRLEPRKGVIEWAEAIAAVAPAHPAARFDFVGGDTPLAVTGGTTVADEMRRHLPRAVRRQVRFHGSVDRAGVATLLADVSAAVVPSRWENFPYSCIEAMSTGLPVLASPHGGMRELIVDGQSGWIAGDSTAEALAQALGRVLAASGETKRAMGTAAAATVRRVCDSASIVGQHLSWKAGLSARPLPTVHVSPSMTGAGNGRASVVPDRRAWPVIVCPRDAEAAALDAARQAVAGGAPGVVLTDAGAAVDQVALDAIVAWLDRESALGLVAGWILDDGPPPQLVLPPVMARPCVLETGAASPAVAVRADVVAACPASTRLALFDAAAGAGWTAALWPGVLARVRGLGGVVPRRRYSSMALAVQRLHVPVLQWLRECSAEDRRRFVADGLKHPGRSARWIAERAVRVFRAGARPGPDEPPPPGSPRPPQVS
ncbi:MAG: glycosyltransferase family 4 protein [Vicinamibacterales bacterium]